MSARPSAPALGGQALIEGVLMRSAGAWAMAVRTPEGTVEVHGARLEPRSGRLRRLPLVRGVLALGASLALGTRALRLSAQLQLPPAQRRATGRVLTALVAALGVVLGIGLFFVAPAAAVDAARVHLPHPVAFVLAEKAVRLALFFGYLALISRRAQVRRVFEFHGAEHKVVACREAGQPLTVANVARFSRLHPRCGTSFVLIVLVLSSVLFAFLGRPDGPVLFLSRLAVLPLVAGLAYEALRALARHEGHPLARLAIRPGLWLQRITTREPDEDQLRVAIAALEAAETLAREPRTAGPRMALAPA
jgi:uncharacterized protein YqhQ